ncbi:MAG: 4Fe-4S binding protein [Candidatus Krumholzibacteriia bacterium]
MSRAWSLVSGTLGRRGLKTYRLRLLVQSGFALLILALGAQFAQFVRRAEALSPAYLADLHRGVDAATLAARYALPTRPPGVEGFLPISGLMGLVDWVREGHLNAVHPAATVLFLVAVALAFLLRKSFCSWLCPVGLLSESLARLGRRLPFLRGRNLRLPRWLDVPLRGLKYLLLGFFLWAVFGMSQAAMQAFLTSDYNQVADVKMLWFFTRMSALAGGVLLLLALGSVFVNGLWCRYLCPYGALLGLVSWASPLRIRRNADACTDCGLCDRVCMARLPISSKARIISPECTGCLDCVASCPTTNALGLAGTRKGLGPGRMAAAVVLLFLAGVAAARITGNWQNAISDTEYLRRIPEAALYDHPR